MEKSIGQEVYEQISSTWCFMHVGLAIDSLVCKSFKPQVPDFISRGHHFDSRIINHFWPQKDTNQNQTYFGSHIFYLSAREIFSGIVEGLKNKDDDILTFREFVEKMLKDQYDDFNIIINFCRNVLSHNVTEQHRLLSSDFESQKKYLIKHKENLYVNLNIEYSKVFSPKYSHQQDTFTIAFDFADVSEDKFLNDFISPTQLMQLVVLSAGLAETYINTRAHCHIEEQREKAKKKV